MPRIQRLPRLWSIELSRTSTLCRWVYFATDHEASSSVRCIIDDWSLPRCKAYGTTSEQTRLVRWDHLTDETLNEIIDRPIDTYITKRVPWTIEFIGLLTAKGKVARCCYIAADIEINQAEDGQRGEPVKNCSASFEKRMIMKASVHGEDTVRNEFRPLYSCFHVYIVYLYTKYT